MKRLIVTVMVIFLGTASTVFAYDKEPQPWERRSDGTTFQSWSFETSEREPAPDPNFYNKITPTLLISEDSLWSDDEVWALCDEIDVFIDNYDTPNEKKEIWLQLTWMGNDDDLCALPPIPQVGATGIPFSESERVEISRDTIDLQDGWKHTTYEINLYPNPPQEWISIKGDILVDHLVIDTRCIPEPATIVLLGAGALITAFRRRKTA